MPEIKILIQILDDDEIMANFLREMLSMDDMYNVQLFTNPEDFIAAFSKSVNLVISDIRIPKYDVFKTVRAIQLVNPSCYIMLISAYVSKEFLLKAIRYRIDSVVEKTHILEDWLGKVKSEVDRLLPRVIEKAKIQQ